MGKSQKLSFDEFPDAIRILTNNKEPHFGSFSSKLCYRDFLHTNTLDLILK